MTMKTKTTASLLALLAMAATPSFAQTELPYDWSFTANAGLFTDYRFRGISQTNKHPAFQGGFDFSHKLGFYVGNWNSNVDSGLYNGGNLEMDFYGGYKGTVNEFSYDVGVLYYYYPGSGAGGTFKIDNTELYVAGGWGPFSLKYSYAVSDFFGVQDTKGAYYLDGTVTYPLTKEFSLVGHIGYQGGLKQNAHLVDMQGAEHDSITDWKLGVTYDLKGWTLGASYIDTNRSLTAGTAALSNKDIVGSTLVLSVSKSF
ncbi:MAG TPA: TorF family putative porin [Burkholderiaceae bacterium]|nr:TorF family putative porin [Burkholderiaceae bacterium]